MALFIVKFAEVIQDQSEKKKNRKKSLSQNQVTYSLTEPFTLNSDEKMLL